MIKGEIVVHEETLLTWQAEFLRTDEDRGEDGTEPPIYTHVYAARIEYAGDGGQVIEWETGLSQGVAGSAAAETLAAKVMLKAAWTKKAAGKGRRGRG